MFQRMREIIAAARGKFAELDQENTAMKNEMAEIAEELENFAASLGIADVPADDGAEAGPTEAPEPVRLPGPGTAGGVS